MPKSKPSPNSESGSSLSEIGKRILHYIQAGYPALYLVSPEEQRIEAELKAVVQYLDKYALCFWSVVDGLVNSSTKEVVNAPDPLEVLQAIQDMKEKGVVLLRDYHLHLQDPNPILVRKLKDVLYDAKYGRDAAEYDTQQLARITEALTGAEIEAVFVESLFSAFESEKEPTDLTVAGVLNDFVPLSRLMKEQIEEVRKWSSGRARNATSCVEERKLRRL